MKRMIYLHNVFMAIKKLNSLSGDDINTRLSVSERLLLGNLKEMGLIGGVA